LNSRLLKLKNIFPEWNSIFLTQPLFNASFYSLKSIFILYVISEYSLTEGQSISIYATFMSLCYAMSLIGGYIADHGLGVKNSALLGGFLTISGLSCLFFPSQDLCFVGLSLTSLGSGFFKPSLLTAIGLIFENPKDPRKDKVYSAMYVVKNIGTLIFPPLCGFVGRIYGWPFGISLVIGIFIISTFLVYKTMRFHPSYKPNETPLSQAKLWMLIPTIICMLYIFFKFRDSFHGLMGIIAIGSATYFGNLIFKAQGQARKDVLSILGYVLSFSLFCALFEQLGSSLLLYFDKAVNRNVMGITLPSSILISLNPLLLIFCSPLVLFFFGRNFEKTRPINGFIKIAVGFLFVALSFGVWTLSTYQEEGSLIPLLWVIGAILFQTIGELLVVPITISKVSQLSSPQNQNVMMSFWTMAIAYGHYIAGGLAQLSIRSDSLQENLFTHYREFFSYLALMALVIGLFILSYRWIRSLYLSDSVL
jgi:POT family proton-dependent oligopeptide transporter